MPTKKHDTTRRVAIQGIEFLFNAVDVETAFDWSFEILGIVADALGLLLASMEGLKQKDPKVIMELARAVCRGLPAAKVRELRQVVFERALVYLPGKPAGKQVLQALRDGDLSILQTQVAFGHAVDLSWGPFTEVIEDIRALVGVEDEPSPESMTSGPGGGSGVSSSPAPASATPP